MQDNTRMAPRLITLAAIALVVAATAVFAWFSIGGVADAAGTGGSTPSVQTQPVQSDGERAPDREGRDGKPCPEEEGGSGASGQDAPSAATPDTEL